MIKENTFECIVSYQPIQGWMKMHTRVSALILCESLKWWRSVVVMRSCSLIHCLSTSSTIHCPNIAQSGSCWSWMDSSSDSCCSTHVRSSGCFDRTSFKVHHGESSHRHSLAWLLLSVNQALYLQWWYEELNIHEVSLVAFARPDQLDLC